LINVKSFDRYQFYLLLISENLTCQKSITQNRYKFFPWQWLWLVELLLLHFRGKFHEIWTIFEKILIRKQQHKFGNLVKTVSQFDNPASNESNNGPVAYFPLYCIFLVHSETHLQLGRRFLSTFHIYEKP
jgi:hypothetical protein